MKILTSAGEQLASVKTEDIAGLASEGKTFTPFELRLVSPPWSQPITEQEIFRKKCIYIEYVGCFDIIIN